MKTAQPRLTGRLGRIADEIERKADEGFDCGELLAVAVVALRQTATITATIIDKPQYPDAEKVAEIGEMLRLLHETYSTLSAAIRLGLPLGDDWTSELSELYDKVGDYLFPCEGKPTPDERLGLVEYD
jgi:hypothetical protein